MPTTAELNKQKLKAKRAEIKRVAQEKGLAKPEVKPLEFERETNITDFSANSFTLTSQNFSSATTILGTYEVIG